MQPLLSEECLETVAGQFVTLFARRPQWIPANFEPGSAGKVFQSVFSASYQMLEILQRLKTEASSRHDSSASDVMAGFIDIPEAIRVASQAISEPSLASHFPPGPHFSETVISHLVIACHTLLLNAYVAVLVALQHDVDLHHGHLAGETQLVLIVQLCAYLLDRQNMATSEHFPAQSQPGSATPTLSAPALTIPDREAICKLEEDIRQRLTQIRAALRI